MQNDHIDYILNFSKECNVLKYWSVAPKNQWQHNGRIDQINSNLSGAETGMCWDNEVNTMTADALAPCVARSSSAMLSTV